MLIAPEQVTLVQLEKIYQGEGFDLDPSCRERVERTAEIVSEAAKGDQPVYGINTGFGKLASVRIENDKVRQLQRNLVISHCAGVGDALPTRIVRLVLALKILSLARGASGVRWSLIDGLKRLFDRGIIPIMPSKGSVGASGDLAPLAHLAATLLGKNEAVQNGRSLRKEEVLSAAELKPFEYAAKEGLAMINGTQVSTALALAGIFDAWRLAVTSITTGALSSDAAMASSAPFRTEVHELRGHLGQIEVGLTLRNLLSRSEIRESHRQGDERVQDPYCIRCQPQVLGAAVTALRQAGETLRVEARAVTDNPLVLQDGTILSGGNFHAEPVGFAADLIAIAIAEIGAIAQRRVSLLVDPANSFGLPAFLTPAPGLNSGFMVAEIVSAALASENKSLSNPRVVDSTPTSADQEDHVAMSCHGARRLLEMNENLKNLIAIEALCGAQGIEMRAPLETSSSLKEFIARIRSVSPFLAEDRRLTPEINAVAQLVWEGKLTPPSTPKLENWK